MNWLLVELVDLIRPIITPIISFHCPKAKISFFFIFLEYKLYLLRIIDDEAELVASKGFLIGSQILPAEVYNLLPASMPTHATPDLFFQLNMKQLLLIIVKYKIYNYNYYVKLFILTIKGGHDGTWSMSHITTLWMVLCLSTSLAADPSPPPIINTVLGLQLLHKERKKCYYTIFFHLREAED